MPVTKRRPDKKPEKPERPSRELLPDYTPSPDYRWWDDFWRRMSKTPGHALTREDLESVLVFWSCLPYFLASGGAIVALDALRASRLLCAAAERRGIDSASLSRAATICLRFADGPFRGRECLPGKPSTWPHVWACLKAFAGRSKPTKQEREIVQAAEDLVGRLFTRLELEPADTGESAIPQDAIPYTLIRQRFIVSRNKLAADRKKGTLKGYRRPGAGKTSSWLHSEADLMNLYPCKKPVLLDPEPA